MRWNQVLFLVGRIDFVLWSPPPRREFNETTELILIRNQFCGIDAWVLRSLKILALIRGYFI
jgi:hypothetical protein